MLTEFVGDLFEFLKAIWKCFPLIRPFLVNLYKQCKVVFLTSPTTTLKYILCQAGCMIVPGTYGSKFLADHAQLMSDEINTIRLGIETIPIKKEKLLKRFYAMDQSSFSPHNKKVVLSTIQEINNFLRPESLYMFERILDMPTVTKHLKGNIEGQAFKQMLFDSNYEQSICKELFEYVALTATALKYKVHIPRRAPYLHGPPGTGKTRLVRQMSRTLGLPFRSIQLESRDDVHSTLFGGSDRYGGNTPRVGSVVDFITRQDPDGVEPNIYPVILFFDEIDTVMNRGDRYDSAKSFFLEQLNGDQEVLVECSGIGGSTINMDNTLIVFAGNELILGEKKYQNDDDHEKELPAEPDKAFNDRVQVVTFAGYDTEMKKTIQSDLIADARALFPGMEIQQRTLEAIDKVVEEDVNLGVRQMKAAIYKLIVLDVAEQDGWVY